ncbi:MAG: 50S ribosomal protein L6 [Bacteroidia bacterium]|nr:50S ribosomal protein L6 [Bacteroidia bacterium]MDW8159376.1 50S ribosomal protein L6 [Bacteroidia bacterium]
MSRIGKQPIPLPKGVSVKVEDNWVIVKGPKGELRQAIRSDFQIAHEDSTLVIKRQDDSKMSKALHGLYRALINNMVIGVNNGYELALELIGVGYRAEAKGRNLELSLGFSHQVLFILPPEVSVTTEVQKGQAPRIILRCIDKQLLGQVAAKIRSIRPPEPYKGKGIRFVGEVVRRKAGKASGKGGKK